MKTMSNEIIYEDDIIIICAEYNPASHIYNDKEINLNISNERNLRRSMIKVTKELIKEFVDNNCHECKAYSVCGAKLICSDWEKFIKDKNKEYERNNN